MKLPNAERASVDERKLRNYLLSRSHPVGRFKAAFFERLGFRENDAQALRDHILQLAISGSVAEGEKTEFGQKYLVSGTLRGRAGRQAEVVSVWIVLVGDDRPRLVTVYPG